MLQLDFAGRVMRENPTLILVVSGARTQSENTETALARVESIAEYLAVRWQISRERIELPDQEPTASRTKIAFRTKDMEGTTDEAAQ
jgi:hypothetical protein